MNYQKNMIKLGKKLNSIKKEFDSEPIYNNKYLKAKIKSYNGKINTNFHNKKIPKKVLNLFTSNFDQFCFKNR